MDVPTPAPVPLPVVRSRLPVRPPRQVAQPGEGWRLAAVAAVFRQGDDDAEILLIERAHIEGDPWSGQIAFPGGRQEPGDTDLEHTARRETSEEVGLDLTARPGVDALGPLDEIRARARQRIGRMAIRPYAFALDTATARTPLQPSSAEVEAAFWTPLGTLIDPHRRTWLDASRAEIPYRFRAVDLGRGRVLWGLTWQMVVDILDRLGLIEDPIALTAPRPLDG